MGVMLPELRDGVMDLVTRPADPEPSSSCAGLVHTSVTGDDPPPALISDVRSGADPLVPEDLGRDNISKYFKDVIHNNVRLT